MEQFRLHNRGRQLDRHCHGADQCESRGEKGFLTCVLFSFSLSLSLLLLTQNYFSDPWNVFDFVIVLGSFIDIIYSEMNVSVARFEALLSNAVPLLFTSQVQMSYCSFCLN